MLKKELVNILACPVCKGDITEIEKENILLCNSCFRAYPIRENIPVMLREEAEILEKEKAEKFLEK
jgi:uncharacterized protein YbaR (Trm112 family)